MLRCRTNGSRLYVYVGLSENEGLLREIPR